MSQQIIVTIIGLLGTAILIPVANKFWQRVFEKGSQLRATVTIYKFELSNYLKEVLAERSKRLEWNDPFKDHLSTWNHTKSLVTLTLFNTSKKRLKNITVIIRNGRAGFYQIGDDTTHPIESEISVGDLQPQHSIDLKIWIVGDWIDLTPSLLKKQFKVSADEFDGVRFKYPASSYIQQRYFLFPGWTMVPSFLLILIAIGIAAFSLGAKIVWMGHGI